MPRYLVEIEISDLMFDRNNGIDDSKPISISDEQLCESLIYRHKNGNLGLPTTYLKGALRNAYIKYAKNWKSRAEEAERYVFIYSLDDSDKINIDLGYKDWSRIFKRGVIINKDKYGAHKSVGTAVNPILDKCTAKFIADMRLKNNSDKQNKDLIELAGKEVGVGGWRKANFGTFRIIKFEKEKSYPIECTIPS